MNRPRIADVARLAGVSKTAVSFAFNRPERLAPETALRIRQVATALGYRPNPVARMLTRGRTMTLGVLAPQALSVVFANPFFARFSAGVAAAAEGQGYGLHFISPIGGSLAAAVGQAIVDGVVALGLAADHPEVRQLRAAGVPLVLVDSDGQPGIPSVVVDDEPGACAAAEHVVAHGHRAVLILSVEGVPATADELHTAGVTPRRLAGYRRALRSAGLELSPAAVVQGGASIEGGAEAFGRAWAGGQRPTAVLAMSDAMAIGVVASARRLGLRIPGDVSVVGFDDIDLAVHLDPPLTTVHQPIAEKAAQAVRLLLRQLRQDVSTDPEHVRLPTRLVVRASSGPVRTGGPDPTVAER